MDLAGIATLVAIAVLAVAALRLFAGRGGPSRLLEGLFARPWELGWPRGVQEDDDAWRHIREAAESR